MEKIFLFAGHGIVYTEYSKEPTEKLLGLIRQFIKVVK